MAKVINSGAAATVDVSNCWCAGKMLWEFCYYCLKPTISISETAVLKRTSFRLFERERVIESMYLYMCFSPDLQRTCKIPTCLKILFCQSKNRNTNCRQHFSILVSVKTNESGKRGKLIFTISKNRHYFDKFDIINLFYRHWIPRYQLPLAI